MATKVVCIVSIEAGKVKVFSRAWLNAQIAGLKDGEYEMTIKRKGRRSGPQNAYYWAVMVPMVREALEDLGHDLDDDMTHELLKLKFNPVDVITKDGELIGSLGGSTTQMNTIEFSEFVERVARWAAETLGITIPPPGGQAEIIFSQQNKP